MTETEFETMYRPMGETEFVAILGQMQRLDPAQFQRLCKAMSEVAANAFAVTDDFAFESASEHLEHARQYVSMRSAN